MVSSDHILNEPSSENVSTIDEVSGCKSSEVTALEWPSKCVTNVLTYRVGPWCLVTTF